MTTQTTLIRRSRQFSLSSTMDLPSDKEERKREYNRLAQREFRRRRKEHMKNLEQAQKEQNSEQSEEIERLRYENDELRRENEVLKTQIYGASSSSSHGLLPTPHNVHPIANERRAYSLSPSISAASMSGTGSPPASLAPEMMGLNLSSTMLPPSLAAYTDPSALSDQPYTMVLSSGVHHSSQSSPETSGYASSRTAMGSSFSSLNIPGSISAHTSHAPGLRRPDSQVSSTSTIPHNHSKARVEIMEIFRPLISDPSLISSPDRHLAALRSMSATLPDVLKPTKAQLETPHYYGIDFIPSVSLRNRLLTVASDVAQSFVTEIGIAGDDREDMGHLIVWSESALDETAWEFSQSTLERWGWMLGREWVQRSNFWRRQRGAPQVPDW